MRNAWRATITAVVCAAGFTATLAEASPALMAMPGHHQARPQTAATTTWPWSKSSVTPIAQPAPVRPSSQISALHHPVKYFTASISEMPIGSKGKGIASTHPAMPSARSKPDAISLSTPTGPPTPEFFIFAAQMCERQGDVPQARQNFQRALSMWPGHVEVLRAAARMEDRQGNLPLAQNLYQQAVASNPQHAGALNDLGLCLARQGQLEPSLQVIEQAVHLQPGKALYRNNAATVLVEMGQDQRALAHLSAVHNAADANFNLGQLLVQRGRAGDAAPYFQTALQQNPNMLPAQEALAKLPGTQFTAAAQTATAPPTAPQPGPAFGPGMPQQGWPTGPQFGYPATARGPAAEASSYVPPQYLPPVASRPGATQR